MRIKIGIDIVLGPADQRIDFDVHWRCLKGRKMYSPPAMKLFAPGNPGVELAERRCQWLDFAQGAASVGILFPEIAGRITRMKTIFSRANIAYIGQSQLRRQLFAIAQSLREMLARVEEDDR